MTVKALVYIHGFLSSPLSAKAQDCKEMAEKLGIEFYAPDVNLPPYEAEQLLDSIISDLINKYGNDAIALAGSSLGGFYAGREANKFNLKAALFNPCLHPDKFVINEVGERIVEATGQCVKVLPSFAEDFKNMKAQVSSVPSSKDRCLVILSTKDEVLPWKETYDELKDHASEIYLSSDDDHRISKFRNFLVVIEAFIK